MPKRFFKKISPDHETIRNHKHMKMFGDFLHDPNIWHMNRRSVSGAFAAGLFWAMIPIPLQMVAAAAAAIIFRVNLPISVALVWITNPLTMPPIFYANYLLGSLFINGDEKIEEFHLTMEWLTNSMSQIWQPLYFGSLLSGIICATIGWISIRMLWRLQIISRLKQRNQRHQS